jgi:hypothetical protein
MPADLAPIAAKLQKFVRMLSSDKDGEVLAAARAIIRTLKSRRLDIHALADAIGRTGNGVSLANISSPHWHEIATWCQDRSDRLRPNERRFIDGMASFTVWNDPSEKQKKWLTSIHCRLGGRMP